VSFCFTFREQIVAGAVDTAPASGWVERMIRKFAIGRNNWLFSTSVEGAKVSGILYSLILTAKLNGKDSFVAMAELLSQLPSAQTIDDYEKLVRLLFNRAYQQWF